MITYGELNLKKIREECDLDFAHYTYKKGQCSCCYGPMDMADKYWTEGRKPQIIDQKKATKYNGGFTKYTDNYSTFTYILFKNADNGSGRIKNKNEVIKSYTCISYRFKDEDQKNKVCKMLMSQLDDDDYVIAIPKDCDCCIVIFTRKELEVYPQYEYITKEDI